MLKKLSFLTCLALAVFTSTAFSQIAVTNSQSQSFGSAALQQATYTLPGFDAGTDSKLVVGFGVEAGTAADFAVTFGGVALTEIQTSTDSIGAEFSSLFFLDGASGVGDVVVTTGPGPVGFFGNGPGIYAVALSGAALGFETSGAFGDGDAIFGELTGTLTGVSDGAYVLSVFTDQNRDGDQTVTGDLEQVSDFSGLNDDQIGSAVSIVASGFGNGSDLSVTFNDLGIDNGFNNRANAVYASFAAAVADQVLVGDVNLDSVVNFLDIGPFIALLTSDTFQAEADVDGNGFVDFLDIVPFIGILSAT